MRLTVLVAVISIAASKAAGQGAPLLQAAKGGHVSAVRSILRQPVDVDARDREGMTALLWAVYGDDREIVRLLLGAGANPSLASQYGVTALSLAAENRNAAVVEQLLAAGANAAAETSGETALHVAARTGAADVAAMLVARGAVVDARDHWQSATPLMVAAAEKQPAVVAVLINAGADVNAKAAETGLFIGPGDESTTYTQIPRGGMTPMMFAARAGCGECVVTLANAGANVNYQDRARVTPLNLAVYNGHFDTAALLLERNAHANDGSVYLVVDMRNLVADGVTADHHPVPRTNDRLDSVALLKQLLARGGRPDDELLKEIQARSLGFNRPNYLSGLTPLQRAAQQADLAIHACPARFRRGSESADRIDRRFRKRRRRHAAAVGHSIGWRRALEHAWQPPRQTRVPVEAARRQPGGGERLARCGRGCERRRLEREHGVACRGPGRGRRHHSAARAVGREARRQKRRRAVGPGSRDEPGRSRPRPCRRRWTGSGQCQPRGDRGAVAASHGQRVRRATRRGTLGHAGNPFCVAVVRSRLADGRCAVGRVSEHGGRPRGEDQRIPCDGRSVLRHVSQRTAEDRRAHARRRVARQCPR